ncbi:hypothetical protein CBER1_05013 [Cercospora berteroae]|uniref:Uncharacterized protein n=1 Tax=Cercospora berteroae TaxID=357750 RepID=A0A2S6BQU2_9PEZI|nr:hypothetical protein CBER1_05013 [Cercospora berteroae]
MPDVVRKQTIKQAKASFKARGRPTLTEKESRQLQRAIELEERADRAREAEKRRLEAAKKRSEKEKREQAQSKQQVQLGTQRRCDRFGYKSSQFHLGAFFRRQATEKPGREEASRQHEQEAFDDDDLDDASLLGAINDADASDPATKQLRPDASLMPPPPRPAAASIRAPRLPEQEDFSDLFDDLDSSTQIARALDSPQSKATHHSVEGATSAPMVTSRPRAFSRAGTLRKDSQIPLEDMCDDFGDLASATQIARELDDGVNEIRRASNASGSSFGSGSLDLTMEDIAVIDPPRPLKSPSLASTAPWPKPSKDNIDIVVTSDHDADGASVSPNHRLIAHSRTAKGASEMPPPTVAAKTPRANNPPTTSRSPVPMKQKGAGIRGRFLSASSLYCSPDLGFTSTQLESFIDDDLQLTQVN